MVCTSSDIAPRVNRTITHGWWLIYGYHQNLFTDIVTWRVLSDCSLMSCD